MKTTLTLEIEYEVDGEMPSLEQVAAEIVESIMTESPTVLSQSAEDYVIVIRSMQNVDTGWIPCDADNPPPAEIPDGMLMALAIQEHENVLGKWPTEVLWVEGRWQRCGRPGTDFTHYLLVEKPGGEK